MFFERKSQSLYLRKTSALLGLETSESQEKKHKTQMIRIGYKKKRSLTLIEMLLVLFLLGTVASVVGFSTLSVLQEEKLNAGKSLFEKRLSFSHELMLMGIDHKLLISSTDKGVDVVMDPERKQLCHAFPQALQVTHLKGIEKLLLDGEPVSELLFVSKGLTVPRGECVLQIGKKQKRFSLERGRCQKRANEVCREVLPHVVS